MTYLIKILALIALVQFVNCESDFKAEDIKAILENIPEEERSKFLRFQINHGYDLVENHYAAYSNISPTISVEIYDYFKKNNSVAYASGENISKAVRSVICFDWGCIDYDDPSIHP